MIAVTCTKCGKTLKAPPEAAGRRARCPQCQTILAIPTAAHPAPQPSPPTSAEPSRPAPGGSPAVAQSPGANRSPSASPVGSPAFPPSVARTATSPIGLDRPGAAARPLRAQRPALPRQKSLLWAWLFAVVLVPLGISHATDRDDLKQRVVQTLLHHPEVLQRLNDKSTDDDVLDALPDQRLEGALLSHGSWLHWLFAAASALLFMSLLVALFDRGNAAVQQLAMVGGITATVGIVNLLMFQWMATHPFPFPGVGLIMAFIGFSYRVALDPHYNFLLSFLGFTFGVGLCEELTKSLPVAVKIMSDKKLNWRGACVWGLASGIGFGVAEAIIYSSGMYNGWMTGGIYLVRFISCVGLHAVWCAATALMLWRDRVRLREIDDDWKARALLLVKAQAVPMVLHGLYDTLLKRGYDGYAVGVAVVSFLWLMGVMHWAASAQTTQPRLARA